MEEVVSIYGDNFVTPGSRMPYHVKTQRCAIEKSDKPVDQDGFYVRNCSPVPKKREEMEIVVPDINDPKKFYKYIVYNHTSCECDTASRSGKNVSLHKTLKSNESKFQTQRKLL